MPTLFNMVEEPSNVKAKPPVNTGIIHRRHTFCCSMDAFVPNPLTQPLGEDSGRFAIRLRPSAWINRSGRQGYKTRYRRILKQQRVYESAFSEISPGAGQAVGLFSRGRPYFQPVSICMPKAGLRPEYRGLTVNLVVESMGRCQFGCRDYAFGIKNDRRALLDWLRSRSRRSY